MILFDLGGVLVELDPAWPSRLGLDPGEATAWLARSEGFAALERGEAGESAWIPAFAREFAVDPLAVGPAFDRQVVGLLPGALDLLDALPGRVALLSNTNPRHWARFDPGRALRSRAAVILPSHLLGARKPEPACWARAERALGGRPALFLDDSPANVEGARAGGWRAVRVDGVAGARAALRAAGLL